MNFFERLSSGKTSLNQSGAGRRLSVIPIDELKSVESGEVPIKAVLPAEQTTAQAKSELERRDINPASVVNMYHSSKRKQRRGIKRKRGSKQSRKGVYKRIKRQRGGGKKIKLTKMQVVKNWRKEAPFNRKRDIFETK